MTPAEPSAPAPSTPPSTSPSDAPPAPGTTPPATPGTSTSLNRADGLLAVQVPEDARVYVNDQPTTSTGSRRQYVSRDLEPGFSYTYEVRAEVVRDGKTLEQVRRVDLRAGEVVNVAFDFPTSDKVETSLTVHVPVDAKVYLAGHPTRSGGPTRVFKTTGLTAGQSWDQYTVRVEVERGGRLLVREETISLKAGQTQELRFDLEGDKLAFVR